RSKKPAAKRRPRLTWTPSILTETAWSKPALLGDVPMPRMVRKPPPLPLALLMLTWGGHLADLGQVGGTIAFDIARAECGHGHRNIDQALLALARRDHHLINKPARTTTGIRIGLRTGGQCVFCQNRT